MIQYQFKLHGLTLIELLIAISILAILMALSLPSYSTYANKNKIGNLTRQLVEALNTTKQLAIIRGAPHYLNLQVNNTAISSEKSCWVISHIGSCDCLVSKNLCQSKYAQVSVVFGDIDVSSNRPKLSFSPLFGMTNGATYLLSLGRFTTKIIVSSQGRIRVCIVHGDSSLYAAC